MVAKSKADVDQATAGASGASVGADQQTAGAQGVTTGYSDVGFKSQTDVAVEEAISTTSASQSNYSHFAVQRALHNQGVLDNLTTQLLQNAIESANMVSKQAVRMMDLAADRQWNVNETDAYSVQALKAVADILRNG